MSLHKAPHPLGGAAEPGWPHGRLVAGKGTTGKDTDLKQHGADLRSGFERVKAEVLLQRQALVPAAEQGAPPAPNPSSARRRGSLLLTPELKDLTMSPQGPQHWQHDRTGNWPLQGTQWGRGAGGNKGESVMGDLDAWKSVVKDYQDDPTGGEKGLIVPG